MFIFFMVLHGSTPAQDSHYWNLQYGTKATLLGGAVIGSVSDLSATYYNPGAIPLFDDPKVILSAKVYQYEKIKVINGAGENKDLSHSSISPSPSFVAFKVKIDSTQRNKLAFSVLTRQSMKFKLETRQTKQDTGNTIINGGISAFQDFDEIWAGATYSHKVSNIIGLGLSPYVAYRNQNSRLQIVVEELQADTGIASLFVLKSYNFSNYRALAKAGIAVNLKPLTFGLTITTPSLNILGSGSFGFNNFINDPDSVSNNVYETNAQDSLKTTYNSSWAMGIGAAYWGKKINIHVSAEWYNAVKKFHPITLKPFYSPTSGNIVQNEINQQFESIINAGIGMEYKLNDKWSIAGSFITDFSSSIKSLKSNISLTGWDIYHVSAGSNFSIGRAEITLGLSYSFGSDDIKQVADIENTGGFGNDIQPTAEVHFTRLKVLFGFVF